MEGERLEEVSEQKDLGITISNDLKPSTHINYITKKANQRCGMIRRCFTNLSPLKVSILYKSIIRPIIETNSTVWNPWMRKDIELLDKAQRRAERLSTVPIKFDSLSDRRRRTDLRETYKFMEGKYKTDSGLYFTKNERGLRGHSKKLQKNYSRTDIMQQFFANRVVKDWNNLREETVSAPSLAVFKERLREERRNHC